MPYLATAPVFVDMCRRFKSCVDIRAILDAVLDPAASGSLETKDESEVQE